MVIALLSLLFSSSIALSAPQPVKFRRNGYHIDVLIGGRLFTTYFFDPQVTRPYLQPLHSAQGTIVTRDFPVGNDVPPEHQNDRYLEPNQRAMMFGHGDIDGIDFWADAAFPKWSNDSVMGHYTFKKLEELRGGPESGTLRADFELVGPEGRVIAEETQTYTFRGDAQSRIIDCEFVIKANDGADVTIGDTKDGIFGIRLAKELDSPPARMVNSHGAVGEKEIWGKRADWVDYDGAVDGETVGVAVFDSPQNLRHPTYWHARSYGLLAANPFGIREFTKDPKQDGSWTIPQHQSLTLRYRVLIHHGDYQQAGVAQAYREYAARQSGQR